METIHQSAEHLLRMINDILDLSKIEAKKMMLEQVPFHLPALLENIVDLFTIRAQQQGITLNFEILSELPVGVYGDEKRVQQIIVNLLGNAFKFTKKGSITIDCQYLGGRAFISIADTGIGIKKENHKSIFEAFSQADASTTRKFGGTGLGLAIAKKLTEKMGGNISLKSEYGKGSTFTVEIPLQGIKKEDILASQITDKEIKITPKKEKAAEEKPKFKILIAEDNKENQLLFSELLDILQVQYDN